MLLDDLVGVIETLKERIAAHGASLRENETRTRMALIDPLLQALGWDVSDPEMVTPEYSVGTSRADYALLTPTGTPSALVEAKKLDESLASHRMQMLNYANISGIPHAGLTDGNHWEMYTVFDQAPIEQRRILDVSIANTPTHEAALQLLLLWRPNLASGQPVAANAPLSYVVPEPSPSPASGVPSEQFVVPNASFVSFPIETSKDNSESPDMSQDQITETGKWVSLAEFQRTPRSTPPSAIRFKRRDSMSVKGYREALIETAKWLIGSGQLKPEHCPIGRFSDTPFLTTSPFARNHDKVVHLPRWHLLGRKENSQHNFVSNSFVAGKTTYPTRNRRATLRVSAGRARCRGIL